MADVLPSRAAAPRTPIPAADVRTGQPAAGDPDVLEGVLDGVQQL